MICTTKRAAWSSLNLTVALLALGCANPAHSASDITFSPATLNFKYQVGAALPASQSLQIKSTATALNFTLSLTGPLPYSAQWLSVSANSGATSATIKVFVNPTGLPSGSYSANIVVNAPGAVTATQTYIVTLDVGDAAATLIASTASVTFNYITAGIIPASQPVVLMTTGGALSASITITGGTWLKASPSASIALVGLPAAVSISVDPTGMAPGAYTGKITFASTTAANKSVSVNATLNVSAGVPAIAGGGLWPPGTLINSAPTIVTITGTNFFSTTTAAIGSTPLAVTMLSATALLATIPASLLTTAGNLSIVLSTPTAATPSAPATFVVYGPGPQAWAVTNAASYTTSTVSPGEILTIYGIGLGPATLVTLAGTSPIATSLPATGAATSIMIDGVAAPLLYTSATQVSCIAPFAVAAKIGATVNLVVTYNSIASATFSVHVVAADPGVFTIDASGSGQGAILNYNAATGDYTVNGTGNAALKGSIAVIYITGYGLTSCTSSTSSVCVASATEAQLIAGIVVPTAAVTVTIDGLAATVQGFAVPIGSVPGLLQINVTVPTGVKAGNAVPVQVTVGSAKSQTRVTMAVK